MTNTQFILHNNQIDKDADVTSSRIVSEIPSDETCVLFLGGSGIVLDSSAARLAGIVAREILKDIADIPNYALIYDSEIMNDKTRGKAQKQIQFEKYNKNIFQATETDRDLYILSKYVTTKNIDKIVRQQIIPRIKKFGVNGIKNLRFIADGDVAQIASDIQASFKKYSAELSLSTSDSKSVVNHIMRNTFSYSKYFEPKYIEDVFNVVLLPRISDTDGNRLPLPVAQRRIRELNILAHCQGAYVALMLADKLQQKMLGLGYSTNEIEQIQSQLLVVAMAPACPLGVSKAKFISFMSAYDTNVERPNNWVTRYVTENRECELSNINKGAAKKGWNLQPGFLSGKNGNVFYAKRRFNLVEHSGEKAIGWDEHNSSHFESKKFTDDGRLLATFARNIIISGIKNSMAQGDEFTPLPPLSELILDGKNNAELSLIFKQMQQNGRAFLKTVCEYARQRIRALPTKNIISHHNSSEKL